MDVKGDKSSYNVLPKASRIGTKAFLEKIFSLFLVKFKKLGFSTSLRRNHPGFYPRASQDSGKLAAPYVTYRKN